MNGNLLELGKPRTVGGVRDNALPWSFVSKNTNYKHQIPNKSQIPIFNTRRKRLRCA